MATSTSADESQYFSIKVVDEATGRGVPLVELETVSHVIFITDSNGLVAINEPELVGQNVHFTVRSHGYEFPKDGFGFSGQALPVEPGKKATIKLKRLNLAERLYRTTGSGTYRDTALLGGKLPTKQPLLNAGVVGCDSVMTALYQDKIYWFWGDTSLAHYPLGIFHITGATSLSPAAGGLNSKNGVDFDYFIGKDKTARSVAEMPGEGPTWIGALTVLRDADNRERMYANYVKIRNLLEAYQWGFVVWNDETQRFDKVISSDKKPAMFVEPQVHTFSHKEADGSEYVYFANPLPLVRVRAEPHAFVDPERYEGFTCLKAGTRAKEKGIDRDSAGRVRYSWQRNTLPLTQPDQKMLIEAGVLKPEEALILLQDADTGRHIHAHYGSVNWNEYRNRWIMIAVEINGESSHLGNVWFAEATKPTGPWVYARQVVGHNKYSFYNPKHHPFFDQDGGRTIFFEGTYTNSFSGNPQQTPRYDYNQLMYQLDLSLPALNLPVPVYVAESEDALPLTNKPTSAGIAFYALDRPGKDTLVLASKDQGLEIATLESKNVLFHALATDAKSPSATTTPLYEYVPTKSGRNVYSTDAEWSQAGYRRSPKPLCRVWKSPGQRPIVDR